MNHLGNFLIGSFGSLSLMSHFSLDELPTGGSLEELINYLVSVVGGILAAIIIAILKRKFPDLFAKLKSRNKS